MSKELEALEPSVLLEFIDGLLKRYKNKTDYNIYITKDWLLEIKQCLERLETIDNSNPSEALDCLEKLSNKAFKRDCFTEESLEELKTPIKQALLKQQEQEKEKLFFKNIHNTKVKTPLVSIFEGLSKDERFKFTEHIYYHWEEMKEALEDKNNELEKENVELKAKAQKEHKALEIIKKKTVDIWLIQNKKTLKQYNSMVDESRQLTEEEFNLLKEILEC